MDTKIIKLDILQKASLCFKQVRQDLIAGASLLWKIKSEELWKEKYDSFSEFLASDCDLSDGQASKLIRVWQFYAVDSGFPQAKITGVDIERLYLATKLDGDPDKKLATASTLSRQELRQSLSEQIHGECMEHEWITFCAKCRTRKQDE